MPALLYSITIIGPRDTHTNKKLGKMKRGNNCTPRFSRVHRCISPVKFRIPYEPGLGLIPGVNCAKSNKAANKEVASMKLSPGFDVRPVFQMG